MNSDKGNKRSAVAKQDVTGHWIDGKPVLPQHTSSRAEQHYLMDTNMNITHSGLDQFRQRADNFQQAQSQDIHTVMTTALSLRDHTSDVFQQSSHMAHTQRGDIWQRRQQQKNSMDSGTLSQTISAELKRTKVSRRQGDLHDAKPARAKEYDNMMDMMVAGKQGPFTMAQSQMGVEASAAGHQILRGQRNEETGTYNNSRVGAQGRQGHPAQDPMGVDLSGDSGSVVRDAVGLPVMMGTSGSSSDVVRSHKAAVRNVSDTLSDSTTITAPGLSQSEGDTAMVKLAHHWMRLGSPAQGLSKQIDAQLNKGDQTRISKGHLFMTQTHTLNEIDTAVRHTLSGSTDPVPNVSSRRKV